MLSFVLPPYQLTLLSFLIGQGGERRVQGQQSLADASPAAHRPRVRLVRADQVDRDSERLKGLAREVQVQDQVVRFRRRQQGRRRRHHPRLVSGKSSSWSLKVE